MIDSSKAVLLKCNDLVVGYGHEKALVATPVNFELNAGEVVALLGETVRVRVPSLKRCAACWRR